jgi:23S rRNA (cytidine1920-2'-O)/16S rRNA (cytidine1409-2'-O)-methyltransferase
MAGKTRLDLLIVDRKLAESRAQAQRLVMAGQVRVAGQVELRPAVKLPPDAAITIDQGPRFVSRGGEKLEGALAAFEIAVEGQVCADVGASTGGFTDCLLQRGAAKIYAIDVGYGILHWKLRSHPRVVVMERTNARFVEKLPDAAKFVSVDASFISLKLLLPVVRGWLAPEGATVVALIKPQFEAGKAEVDRGEGVIRDEKVHREVLTDILTAAQSDGFGVKGLIRSPLLGPKGNKEFLMWLEYPRNCDVEMQGFIDFALGDGEGLEDFGQS